MAPEPEDNQAGISDAADPASSSEVADPAVAALAAETDRLMMEEEEEKSGESDGDDDGKGEEEEEDDGPKDRATPGKKPTKKPAKKPAKKPVKKMTPADRALQKEFMMIDMDNTGFIDKADLKKATGGFIPEAFFTKAIKMMDTNKDGKISFEEYKTMRKLTKSMKEALVGKKTTTTTGAK